MIEEQLYIRMHGHLQILFNLHINCQYFQILLSCDYFIIIFTFFKKSIIFLLVKYDTTLNFMFVVIVVVVFQACGDQ